MSERTSSRIVAFKNFLLQSLNGPADHNFANIVVVRGSPTNYDNIREIMNDVVPVVL